MSPLRRRQVLLVVSLGAVLLALGVVVNGVAGALSVLVVGVVVTGVSVWWGRRRRSVRGG